MIETDKLRCRECAWKGREPEALKAANPFRVDELIYGCPECREINTLREVCDEAGCWKGRNCGFKSKSGKYRNTCTEHSEK